MYTNIKGKEAKALDHDLRNALHGALASIETLELTLGPLNQASTSLLEVANQELARAIRTVDAIDKANKQVNIRNRLASHICGEQICG